MSDMTFAPSQEREDERRDAIMAGASACFLQYGFAKTSLDDIAQRAGISRPLIYRKFKNKEDILAALYDFKFTALYPQVDAVLATRGVSKRETMLRMWEILLLNAWAELMQVPMVSELLDPVRATCLSLRKSTKGGGSNMPEPCWAPRSLPKCSCWPPRASPRTCRAKLRSAAG